MKKVNEYFKQQTTPIIFSETQNITTSHNKILHGVVACLDVRTEDGDDVSQNFERALQSMGAKTRRTFSDSVTHLIFKNGSPATLKKALSKKVFIINLLWISRCKREGRRLPEKDFIIEKPQTLALAGKKRQKSMEPSKVKALGSDEIEPSLSTSSEGSLYDDVKPELRRQTIGTVKEWKKSKLNESELRKRHIAEAEEDSNNEAAAPRLSLPLVESSKHASKKPKYIIPINAPDTKVQEQIKARFSIGQTSIEDDVPRSNTPPLIKRKRRLTGNMSRPPLFQNESTKSKTSTIVLTNMLSPERKRCEEAVKKLGQYELAQEVTEQTTHVIVGIHRRATSVALGLLRGAWILSPDWLIQSATKGKYVPEQEFELIQWYPRADMARKKTKLLPTDIRIRVYSSTTSSELIEEFIRLSGATVVKKNEEADIILCTEKQVPVIEKNRVTENWLFDSIEQWQYIPTEKYMIKH